MIETKTREISLKETLFKPFLIVLKLSYEIAITPEEWLDLKVQELCESIVTANRYQFIECEKQLSQKLIDVYEFRMRETGDLMVDNTSLWEVLEMAKLHNLMFLFRMVLDFFDENIEYASNTFDKQLISAEILLDVIRRDTFGAAEPVVFSLVHKWIQKQRTYSNMKSVEEQLLLESVRLNLMNFEDLRNVGKTGVYDPDLIDRYIKHDLGPDLAPNHRICYESNKVRKIDCHNDIQLKSEHVVVICVNCHLPMKTKINHLMFNIKPIDGTVMFEASYWIGIEDSQAENGFRKVLDYTHNNCVGEQDLYFDTPFVTRSLRIVVECAIQRPAADPGPPPPSDDPLPGPAGAAAAQPQVGRGSGTVRARFEEIRRARDEWRRRSFRHRMTGHSSRVLTVTSLEYEFNKRPLKTFNSCIIPEVNVCSKFGTSCHSPYFGARFVPLLTELVLNNETLSKAEFLDDFLWRSMDEPPQDWRPIGGRDVSRKTFYRCLERPIRGQDHNNPYIIRLSQPVVTNCLQVELVLEHELNKQSDVCLAAECRVELCRNFTQDLSGADWSLVANDSYIQESGFYNLEFDYQTVSVIKISGFRYNSDKSLKYCLHLKNLSIPGDRQSWSWASGHRLRTEQPIDNQEVK